MNIIKYCFITFLITTTVSWSQTSPNEKTKSEYWQDTQTSFEQILYGEINDSTCIKNLKLFIACMNSLNHAVQIHYPQYRYMIEIDHSKKVNFISPLVGFIIKAYAKDTPNIKDIENNYYTQLECDYNFWLETRFISKNFNFNFAIKHIEQNIKNINDEAYIAGSIYNKFLENAYDPHTYIMPKEISKQRVSSYKELKIFGIIVKIKKIDGKESFIITKIVKDSPVSRSGMLEIGDIILEIDNQLISKEVYENISSKNKITLLVDGSKGQRTIKLERDLVLKKNLEISIIKDPLENNYGLISLDSFMDLKICADLDSEKSELVNRYNIKGVILDLRNNLGGFTYIAQCLLNFFLEKDSFTFIKKDLRLSGENSVDKTYSDGKAIFNKMHNVVLINGYSASASELVSIYLQAYRKAFVVGEKSFGKGTAQMPNTFLKNSKIDYYQTFARFYGPHYVSPQLQGVEPDFTIFPEYGQNTPTPYSREADLYKNVISNKYIKPPVMQSRLEQINALKNCLRDNQLIQKKYESLDYYKKEVFDQQLFAATAILSCANELDLLVFKSSLIPTAKDSDLFQ